MKERKFVVKISAPEECSVWDVANYIRRNLSDPSYLYVYSEKELCNYRPDYDSVKVKARKS